VDHLDLQALEAGVDEIRGSPADDGRVELLVRRPTVGERELIDEATIDAVEGFVGDSWRTRASRRQDGSVNRKAQLTLTNARAIALIAQHPERWALAGDQIYVDLDLSGANIPPGTRLEIGSAVVEISDVPHTGCRKFLDRFGKDALRFVNSDVGRELNLRGVNATVVITGVVRRGDAIRKSPS